MTARFHYSCDAHGCSGMHGAETDACADKYWQCRLETCPGHRGPGPHMRPPRTTSAYERATAAHVAHVHSEGTDWSCQAIGCEGHDTLDVDCRREDHRSRGVAARARVPQWVCRWRYCPAHADPEHFCTREDIDHVEAGRVGPLAGLPVARSDVGADGARSHTRVRVPTSFKVYLDLEGYGTGPPDGYSLERAGGGYAITLDSSQAVLEDGHRVLEFQNVPDGSYTLYHEVAGVLFTVFQGQTRAEIFGLSGAISPPRRTAALTPRVTGGRTRDGDPSSADILEDEGASA